MYLNLQSHQVILAVTSDFPPVAGRITDHSTLGKLAKFHTPTVHIDSVTGSHFSHTSDRSSIGSIGSSSHSSTGSSSIGSGSSSVGSISSSTGSK